MWSWRNWAPIRRFRITRALSGTSRDSASSTQRTEVEACTYVQTPHNLWVKCCASSGRRPLRIVSTPRNRVPELQALVIWPLDTSTSMRRCPSIRVTGSMTILFPIGGGGGGGGGGFGRGFLG